MAKSQNTVSPALPTRYEYRVWGRHESAREILAALASDSTDERIKDCYLIGDDASWNVKVRNNRLKVKQLIAEHQGFESWSSDRPRSAKATPSPFDELFEQLRLDRPQRGKSYDLQKAVSRLGPDSGTRAIFVVKHRRRYTVGGLRAEATDIEIIDTSEVLHTLAIEGDDLDELVALRLQLGLCDTQNTAVHEAIDPALDE